MNPSIEDALISLQGLSVGDAFGEQFFTPANRNLLSKRELPHGPWGWTDDTIMAVSIVEILKKYGEINQDALAKSFADEYMKDPFRGYGMGAAGLLRQIAYGENWRQAAPGLFDGGSFGNGAAMRAAPIGGFFKGDPKMAAEEAKKSAQVTHAHPEGISGAIAVAVAASIAAVPNHPKGTEFLNEILPFIPDSETRDRINEARDIPGNTAIPDVAQALGSGMLISAQDTVPYCMWCAAYNLDNYEDAMWQTIAGFGDCDTTCAIVGGITALSSRNIPLA